MFVRALLPIVAVTCFSGCGPRLSAPGETCSRTADCADGARCVAATCVASARHQKGGFETIEALAAAVVQAVASGQSERLGALVIPADEAEAMLRASEVSETDIPEALAGLERVRAELPRRWERLLADSTRMQVKLSDLKYVNVLPYQVVEERGLTLLANDLTIQIVVGDRSELVLDVEGCIKGPGGWWLADPEVELEGPRGTADDGESAAVDEVAPLLDEAERVLVAHIYYGCTTCHNTLPVDLPSSGPSLFGRFGTTTQTDKGPVVYDEAYVREAILDPAKSIVTGYKNTMPSYRGVISDAELDAIVAWLKQLQP